MYEYMYVYVYEYMTSMNILMAKWDLAEWRAVKSGKITKLVTHLGDKAQRKGKEMGVNKALGT